MRAACWRPVFASSSPRIAAHYVHRAYICRYFDHFCLCRLHPLREVTARPPAPRGVVGLRRFAAVMRFYACSFSPGPRVASTAFIRGLDHVWFVRRHGGRTSTLFPRLMSTVLLSFVYSSVQWLCFAEAQSQRHLLLLARVCRVVVTPFLALLGSSSSNCLDTRACFCHPAASLCLHPLVAAR